MENIARDWSKESPGRTDWISDKYGNRWTSYSKIADAMISIERVHAPDCGTYWVLSWAVAFDDEVTSLYTHGILFKSVDDAKAIAEKTIVDGPQRNALLAEIDARYANAERAA